MSSIDSCVGRGNRWHYFCVASIKQEVIMRKFQRILLSFEYMTNLSQELVKLSANASKSEMREKIDQFRNSRALLLEDQALLEEGIEKQELSIELVKKFKLHLEIEKVADNFIADWVRELNIDTSSNKNAIHVKEINDLLDMLLPKTWNFNSDIIVIEEFHKSLCYEQLVKRGQKRFVITCEKNEKFEENIVYTTGKNADKIMEHFIFPHPKTLNFLSLMINSDTTSKRYKDFTEKFKDELHKSIIKINTMRRFSKIWTFNSIQNIPSVLDEGSIWDLYDYFKGRDAIVISPGPSLTKNISELKQNKNKIIFAVAQSVPSLLDVGIIPHFVLVIDPQNYTEVLNKLPCEEVSLICPEYIDRSFTENNFKNIFYCHSGKGSLNFPKYLNTKRVDMDNAASVSVAAVSLLVQLGVSTIALVGQDLSWEDHQYSSSALDVEIFEKNNFLPGYYGGKVQTGYTYFIFHGQLQEIAQKNSRKDSPTFFNCTEGGAYIEGFQNLPLRDFLEYYPKRNYIHDDIKRSSFSGYSSFYKSQIKAYLKQIDLLIPDLEKWINYSSPASKEKGRIETRIFNKTNTIPILKDAVYSELWRFADTFALGFNNDLVEFQKRDCVEKMLEISKCLRLELLKVSGKL